MVRTRLVMALAVVGFVGTALWNAAAPLPTPAHSALQLPPATPTPGAPPPDTGGARGFDLGGAAQPYFLDSRAEPLFDN